jgi:hypothetical protein
VSVKYADLRWGIAPGFMTQASFFVFLLSEAKPKNALVTPPNLETIATCAYPPTQLAPARTIHARPHNSISQFFLQFQNPFINFSIIFTIFKLISTTEQMPALVLNKNYLPPFTLAGPGLPDFSWYMIPKAGKSTKNLLKMFQMVIKHTNGP